MNLLLITFFLSAATASAYRYKINFQLDDAVEEFNMKVLRNGDEYVSLDDSLSIGGFVLTRSKLADMSSLERVGDSWLKPLKDSVEISANLKFGKMHMDGTNLTGPEKNVDKPRITARENLVEVLFKGRLETTSSYQSTNGQRVVTKYCFATYDASLTKLSSVVLVTRDGVSSVDSWIEGLFPQIAELLNPFLIAIFEKHFDLCESLKKNGYTWSNFQQ